MLFCAVMLMHQSTGVFFWIVMFTVCWYVYIACVYNSTIGSIASSTLLEQVAQTVTMWTTGGMAGVLFASTNIMESNILTIFMLPSSITTSQTIKPRLLQLIRTI